MTPPTTSIVQRDFAPTTRTEQTVEPAALVADTAQLRDYVTETTSEATQLHLTAQQLHLNQLTRKFEAVSPAELLDMLADDFLFPWSLLARVVSVSPTAVRKWRRGEAVSPVHHQRLAEFLAFCNTLQWRNPLILNVPHWLEMPVEARADVTRLDLFLDRVRIELLDLATGRTTGESLLDETSPGWRERANRVEQFEVLTDEDGMTSIVPRAEAVPREG